MLSQRSRPLVGLAVACVAATVTACSGFGGSDAPDGGPPRISPEPRPEVASAMVDDVLEPGDRLDTCGLLGLTAEEVIELTGAEMPVVEPTGLGELGMPCTYGGPGSPERLQAAIEAAGDEAEAEAEAEAEEQEEAEEEAGTETTETDEATDQEAAEEAGEEAATGLPAAEAPATVGPIIPEEPEAEEADPEEPALDPLPPEEVPLADTVAAGMAKPRSGAPEALAGQPLMLGSRYACSEVRGQGAETVPGELTGVPEAPAPAGPDLATPYIDCIAAPTGGGVEVHTIFVADNDLWHLTFTRPGTPRSPEADAEALEGLHRVAEHVLS